VSEDLMRSVPGRDRVERLIDDIRHPVLVHSPVLIDVSFIEDPGMRAVVVLAASLEWNVVVKQSRPVTLISRDGFKHVIPTETSIKFNVFRNRVNATITHSLTAQPTLELMEHLIKQFKLGPSHARVFRAAVGEGVMDDVVSVDDPDEGLPEPELGADVELVPEPGPAPALDRDEEATTPVVEPFSERVEPTLSTTKGGDQYESPIMETVIRQLVKDGDDQITYRCIICGLEFETKRGVGGHYGRHVAAGEAEGTSKMKKPVVNKIPDYVPTEVHAPKGTEAAELRRLRTILSEVQRAVGMDQIKDAERRVMVAQRKQAEAEAARDVANARAERLAGDLRSLRELIGGLSDD